MGWPKRTSSWKRETEIEMASSQRDNETGHRTQRRVTRDQIMMLSGCYKSGCHAFSRDATKTRVCTLPQQFLH
jgi:hypothetical protein